MKKQVEKQILHQTRDRLGAIDIGKSNAINFKSSVPEFIEKQTIVWVKKHYIFDRGIAFPLGSDFWEWSGQFNFFTLASDADGGCYDDNIPQYSNICYSIAVKTNQNQNIKLPIKVSNNINLSFSIEDSNGIHKIISPTASYFNSNNVTFLLLANEWVTLKFYVYSASENGFVSLLRGLSKYITAWSFVDVTAPSAPEWYTTPIITESDNNPAVTKNILQWKIPSEFDWAGHNIYRKEAKTIVGGYKEDSMSLGGFLLDDRVGDYVSGEYFSIGDYEYKVKNKKYITGNLINNGGFNNASASWSFSSTGTTDAYTVYNDYRSFGASMYIAAATTVATKYAYIESESAISVSSVNDYDFLLDSKRSGSTAGVAVILFYQDNGSTLCSTSSCSPVLMATSNTWVSYSNKIYGVNNGDGSFYLPSDCNYIKIKVYDCYNDTHSSKQYFDNIKFSVTSSTKIFSDSTVDGYCVIPTKPLTSKPTIKTFLHIPFVNTSNPTIGSIQASSNGHNFRTHRSFNLMAGGISFTNIHTNKLVNSDLNTTNGWSTSGCSLTVGYGPYYDPLFNGYAGKITPTVATGNSYIYQNKTSLTTASAYALSVYARGYGSYLYLEASSGAVDSTSISLSTSWTRYDLFHTVNGTVCAAKIGISEGYTNTIFVDGAIFERTSKQYPNIYDPSKLDGTTPSVEELLDCTGIGYSTSAGSISFYIVPQTDSENLLEEDYIFVTGYDQTDDRRYSTAIHLFEIEYRPSLGKFGCRSKKTIATEGTVYSTVTSFDAGQRIFIGLTWQGSDCTLYVDSAATTGTFAQPEIDSIQFNGQYLAGTNYYAGHANITDFQFSTGGLSLSDVVRNKNAEYHNINELDTSIEFTKWQQIGTKYRSSDSQEPIRYTDSPVVPNTYYIYVLDCFDYDGNRSALSATAGVVAGDAIPPGPITDTAAFGFFGGITYGWTNPLDLDFDGCKLYADAGLTTFIDNVTGLVGEQNYYDWTTDSLGAEDKTVYVTTYDRLGNENTDSVESISGTSISASDIMVAYSSSNPYDGIQGKWFKQGPNTVSFYIHCDQFLSTARVKLYDGNGIEAFSDIGNFVNVASHIETWAFEGTYTTGKTSGPGEIVFTATTDGGVQFSRYIPVQWDVDQPTIDNVTGLSTSGTDNKMILSLPFSSNFDDDSGVRYIWVDHCTAGIGHTFFQTGHGEKLPYNGDYATSPYNVAIIFSAEPLTHSVRARVYDVAGNYAEYTDGVLFRVATPEVEFSLTSDADKYSNSPYANGWLGDPDTVGFATLYQYFHASSIAADPITRLKWRLGYKENETDDITWDLNQDISWDGSKTNYDCKTVYDNFTADSGTMILEAQAITQLGRNAFIQRSWSYDQLGIAITGGNIFDDMASGPMNRGSYLKILIENIVDSGPSGHWKTILYRCEEDDDIGSWWTSLDPIYVFTNTEDNYVDYDERLEGYRTYVYKAVPYDNAGNYNNNGATITVHMTPDWEYTYRNIVNNGSFEVFKSADLTDDQIESWSLIADSGGYIADDTACFGKYSFWGSSENTRIRNEAFIPQISLRPAKYILSYYKRSDDADTINFRFMDYKGDQLALKQIANTGVQSGGGAGNSKVGADSGTWYRYWYSTVPGNWAGATAECTSIQLDFFVGGYIDGIQFEEATANQTFPTTYRDNRVLTTDRFQAGFILANHIKAAQIHGGHIIATGLEVKDDEYGAPSITVGNYDAAKTFMRMEDNRLYYHPSASGFNIDEGFGFTKHIETKTTAFGHSAWFSKPFTRWDGTNITPQCIWTPAEMVTYGQAYAGDDQKVVFSCAINSTSIAVYGALRIGTYYDKIESITTSTITAIGDSALFTLNTASGSNTIELTTYNYVSTLDSYGYADADYYFYIKAASGTWRLVGGGNHSYNSLGWHVSWDAFAHGSCNGATDIKLKVKDNNPGDTTFDLQETRYLIGTVYDPITGTAMGYYRVVVFDGG